MEYRFRLGRTPVGDNLFTDGDFAGGAIDWVFGGGWTLVGLEAHYIHPGGVWGNGDTLSQAAVFTVGKWHRLTWDWTSIPAAVQDPFMSEHIGSFGSKMRVSDDFNFAPLINYTVDRICLEGIDFGIKVWSEFVNPPAPYYQFLNFDCRLLDYNVATDDPVEWKSSNLAIKKSTLVDGFFVTFIDNLTFYKSAYDFIFAEYVANGICGRIPILIENFINGSWETFFEGIINISECQFNLEKQLVKCPVEDITTSKLIQKGKDRNIRFEPRGAYSEDYSADVMPDPRILVDFNDGAGGYATFTNRRVYKILEILQRQVLWATDFEVLLESDLFSAGDIFENFALTIGKIIRLATGAGLIGIDFKIFNTSFANLITEINNLIPIGFRAFNAAGVPTIEIERKTTLQDGTVILTLEDIKETKFKFDTEHLYQNIEIGYKNYDEDRPFAQGSVFLIGDTCGENSIILVSDYLQSSTLIYAALAGSTTFDEHIFWIEINAAGTETKNGAGPGFAYNFNIDAADNMARWEDFMQLFNRKVDGQKNDKAIPSFLRIFEFPFPITKAQWDIIAADPQRSVRASGNNLEPVDGLMQEVVYPMKNDTQGSGITKFKLLTE